MAKLICKRCLFGPIHHPRCPSPNIKVEDDEALNSAELTQIDFMKSELIPNKGKTYGPFKAKKGKNASAGDGGQEVDGSGEGEGGADEVADASKVAG